MRHVYYDGHDNNSPELDSFTDEFESCHNFRFITVATNAIGHTFDVAVFYDLNLAPCERADGSELFSAGVVNLDGLDLIVDIHGIATACGSEKAYWCQSSEEHEGLLIFGEGADKLKIEIEKAISSKNSEFVTSSLW